MKIHYFDFVATGGVHTTFNSAMIEVLNKVYPGNEGIILHSEKEHGKIVQEKCESEIEVKKLKLLFSKIIHFSKIRDLFAINFILPTMIKASRDDVMYVGLAFPFSIHFINFFSKILKKHVFITLHGELQYFLPCDKRYIQIQHKKYFCSIRNCLTKENKYITFVILGEPIYKAVSSVFKDNKNIIVINHPAIFSSDSNNHNRAHHPLTIGIIGGGLERKGVESIFKVAGFLKEEILQNKVLLKICGLYSGKTENENKNLVSYFDKVLSETELEKEIQNLDYSFQFSTDSICKAIASGTFIDSLIFEKPVIGLHSSYLDFYCPKDYPLFDSEQEIAEKIKKYISVSDDEFYKKDLDMTVQIRNQFSVDYNAQLFKKQMEFLFKCQH